MPRSQRETIRPDASVSYANLTGLRGLPDFIRRPKTAPAWRVHDKHVVRLHQRFRVAGEFFNASICSLDHIAAPLAGLTAGQSIRFGQAVAA